jgi:cytochrome c-type biogenesis protein
MDLITLWLAGVLIVFSPCILPVLPLIIAASLQVHRLGPLLMTIGLIIGFVLAGTLFYILSHSFHLPNQIWRYIAAGLLIILGILMCSHTQVQWLWSDTVNQANVLADQAQGLGLGGQVMIGMLLGVIWSPCIGPALGAVVLVMMQAQSTLTAGLGFMVFALGTAFPILCFSYGGRMWVRRFAPYLMHSLPIMGYICIFIGVMILTSMDQWLQIKALSILPDRWLALVTRY